MIETLEIQTEFDLKEWPRLPEEHWSQSNVGASNQSAHLRRGRIPGLHIQMNQRGSEAVTRLSMNLPTLSYGTSAAKVGTLEPERLEDAIAQGIKIAHNLLPGAVPKERFDAFDVKRYDFNMTCRPESEPNEEYAEALIEGAAQVARRDASRKRHAVLYTSDSSTAARGIRGSKRQPFERFYNKTVEALGHGYTNVPGGLIRMESEHRPATPTTVSEWASVVDAISEDNQRKLAEWFTQAATAMIVVTADEFLWAQEELDGKKNPAEAIEMAAIVQMLGTHGVRALTNFGYSKTSAYRKKHRCEQLLARIGEKSFEDSLYRYWESQGWLFSQEAAETVKEPDKG